MDTQTAATNLEALGSPTRLEIFRLLVRAGQKGAMVGELQKHLDIPASTLSHHLTRLVYVGLVLAPVRNYTKITGFEVGQTGLRTQLTIDALSQKKGAAQLLRVISAFNSPLQLSGIGGFGSVSVANVSSQGENLRVVHEPVGDRYAYRAEIALFSASAKGHHVAFMWRRSLMMWENRYESCWLRER